jgi:hypothetical protein
MESATETSEYLIGKPAKVLNSWKEIAGFFDRGVRTVQRWERTLQLPVHRIGRGKRSPVYAVSSELRFWRLTSAGQRAMGSEEREVRPTTYPRSGTKQGRALTARLYELARAVAENSVRHQQQAQALEKQLQAMQSRIRHRAG